MWPLCREQVENLIYLYCLQRCHLFGIVCYLFTWLNIHKISRDQDYFRKGMRIELSQVHLQKCKWGKEKRNNQNEY